MIINDEKNAISATDDTLSATDDTLSQESNTSNESLLGSSFSLFKNFIKLINYESQLSIKSLIAIGFLMLSILLFFTAGWIIGLISFSLWLVSIGFDWQQSLQMIAILNIIIIIPCYFGIKYYLKKCGYQATLRQLSSLNVNLGGGE